MNENLVKAFKPYLDNPIFQEVLELVKENSQGKIWIIGGYVYKNLASALYGTASYEYDIDFIVEHKNKNLREFSDWRIENNSYNNPNYIRDTHKMSFTDIHEVIRVSGVKNQTIEGFILETPLNVQSIAYDISAENFIGETGMTAIKEKIVKVNNMGQAEFYAQRKHKTVEEILIEKAKELSFTRV